jgi:hypothetical protein
MRAQVSAAVSGIPAFKNAVFIVAANMSKGMRVMSVGLIND